MIGLYHKSIDFSKYGEQTTMDVSNTIVTSLLDTKRLNKFFIPARQNDIESEEAFIQLGYALEYTF